jgi:hypothetical protein
VPVQQAAAQPAASAARPQTATGGGSSQGAFDAVASATTVYPVPKVTAPVVLQTQTETQTETQPAVLPTSAQQPDVPWPAVLVTLATLALATALSLRRHQAQALRWIAAHRPDRVPVREWERSLLRGLRSLAGRWERS